MARYFTGEKIEQFKECFDFHARRGHISHEGDLSIIMRSLSFSPTREEISKYFKKHVSHEGQLDFASFLDVMHEHSSVENCKKELQAALVAQDRSHLGYVNCTDVRQILTSMGEKLSRNEVDTLFREAGIPPNGQVKISEFVQTVMTPSPDY
ncbi:calmodulin-like protein 4 [Littorina saxatilis]|uniref:EF-hand domain-containing protein n=1 Tax=Littorina saxatilis TaxID=31220 RepID=A0AAN9G6C0_9CAEN